MNLRLLLFIFVLIGILGLLIISIKSVLQKLKGRSITELIIICNLIFILLGAIYVYLSVVSIKNEAFVPFFASFLMPILALYLFYSASRIVYVKEGSWKSVLRFSLLTFLIPLFLLLNLFIPRFWGWSIGLVGRVGSTTLDETTNWKTYQNEFYSLTVPGDWEEAINDVGSALDKRLAGYVYGPYVNLECGTLPLAECDPAAPSRVNISVLVYSNKDSLSTEDYVKKYIHADFPNPVKLSDGSLNQEYRVIPATAERGSGVHATFYFVSGDVAERYYFANEKYIYDIAVTYSFSKADIEKGIKIAYQEILQKYGSTANSVINSFKTIAASEIGGVPPVSSWTSYRFDEFDLKYPSNWSGPGFGDSGQYTLSGFLQVDQRIVKIKIALDILNDTFALWQESAKSFKNDSPVTVGGVTGTYYTNFEKSPGTHTYLFHYQKKTVKIEVVEALELNQERLEERGISDLPAQQKINAILREIVSTISWKQN